MKKSQLAIAKSQWLISLSGLSALNVVQCLLSVWSSFNHPLTPLLDWTGHMGLCSSIVRGYFSFLPQRFMFVLFILFIVLGMGILRRTFFEFCLHKTSKHSSHFHRLHTEVVLLPAAVESDPRSEVDLWTGGRGPKTPHRSTTPPPPPPTSTPAMSKLLLEEEAILSSELELPNQPLHKHTKCKHG